MAISVGQPSTVARMRHAAARRLQRVAVALVFGQQRVADVGLGQHRPLEQAAHADQFAIRLALDGPEAVAQLAVGP